MSDASGGAIPPSEPPQNPVSDDRVSGERGVGSEGEAAPPAVAPRTTRWLAVVAVAVAVVSLVGPISASGIWDPPELEVVDLARRIAHTLLGGASLAIQGANNLVPTQGELGRGQLPFTSIAVGLRVFGMSEWAGRLPLALWGLLGIGATALLVARLADRRAAAFSAIALATMPLYFLHARTMLGDITTMATLAVAVAGLAIAVFDRRAQRHAVATRAGALAAGVGAMVLGVLCRGVLIGAAVPAMAVGGAWLLGLGHSSRPRDRVGDVAGGFCLVLAAVALGMGVQALSAALDAPGRFSLLLGTAIHKSSSPPSFDVLVVQLGHALVPWSALVPFALGRMFGAPPGASADESERQGALRSVLVLTAVLTLGVQTWLVAYVGPLPFAAPFALAAVVGLYLSDFERGAPGSRALGMGVAAMAILLALDFLNTPEKGLTAFVVSASRFPESFRKPATHIMVLGMLASAVAFFFAAMERGDAQGRDADYRRWWGELKKAFNGNVYFTLLVAEGALLAGGILLYASDNYLHLSQMTRIGVARYALTWGWVVLPLVAVLLPIVVMVLRDLVRLVASPAFGLERIGDIVPKAAPVARRAVERVPRLRSRSLSRGVVAAVALTSFGLVLSLGYYPALAAQISPKEVFEAYRAHAHRGEPLGMLGRGKSASAAYYAGRQVPSFVGDREAFDWLVGGEGRRWLVIRSSDLPQLNSLYRAHEKPPHNLPVLDARSSEIMLVSNRLEPGERNDNPFDGMILNTRPQPAHALDADLGGQLHVLGWSVTTPDGSIVRSIEPGRHYEFTIYYEVQAPISGAWETFVHIDGYQRRHNADHPTLQGKYPLHLWRTGDYIADTTELTLEPNFTPGTYDVYFGLFVGSRRLEVKRGRNSDNRIAAGHLEVR